ncbi:hypothetical protein [Hyphomicrobium sp. D-2]|uniref:hypothetical protein n=1 Tax=Hyphomicrobium sp. D-2 TaxID=3041621 RepID=UPI00245809CE|nr:hypothetical protein [Hyphomicrobium sp. D-2]MDH4982608.1 hypothetical protein [Hyphomicrobium sp. D-2]
MPAANTGKEVAFAAETNERAGAKAVVERRPPQSGEAPMARLTLEPTNWLELSAGARFDHCSAEGREAHCR